MIRGYCTVLAVFVMVSLVSAQTPSPVSELAQKFIRDNDNDGDGKLTVEEFPKRRQHLFESVDRNQDGFVDTEEDAAFRQRQRQSRRVPEGVKAHLDVRYAMVGDKELLLDIYLPGDAESDQLPLIVWIHGGAWRGGNKQNCPALPFTKRGYVAASISYRLSQEAIFPAQIEDCKAAIRWLRAHAKQYKIDPDRIGVWGSSAGGHLVALLGTSGDVKELEGSAGNLDQSSRVQAVCDFFGPTDFLRMDADSRPGSPIIHDAADSPESRLVGGAIQDHPEKVARANPITYVTKDDPPFLIVHGDADPLVPWQQSKYLFDKMQQVGLEHVRFHLVKGAGHGFGGRDDVSQMVAEFFDEYLP